MNNPRIKNNQASTEPLDWGFAWGFTCPSKLVVVDTGMFAEEQAVYRCGDAVVNILCASCGGLHRAQARQLYPLKRAAH